MTGRGRTEGNHVCEDGMTLKQIVIISLCGYVGAAAIIYWLAKHYDKSFSDIMVLGIPFFLILGCLSFVGAALIKRFSKKR